MSSSLALSTSQTSTQLIVPCDDLDRDVSLISEKLQALTTLLQTTVVTTQDMTSCMTSLQLITSGDEPDDQVLSLIASVQSAVNRTSLQISQQNSKKMGLFKILVEKSQKLLQALVRETTLAKKKVIFLEGLLETLRDLHNKSLLAIESQTKALQDALVETEKMHNHHLVTTIQAKFLEARVTIEKDKKGIPTAVVMW